MANLGAAHHEPHYEGKREIQYDFLFSSLSSQMEEGTTK